MNTVAATPSGPLNKRLPSCVRCSDRKVKCDRQRPCSACVKHGDECAYRPPQSRKRLKHGKVDTPSARLARLEAVLRMQGIDQPDALSAILGTEQTQPALSETQSLTPVSITSEQQRSLTKTQIVQGPGRSSFVDNSLWSRVVEEIGDPEEALEEDSLYEASDTSEDDQAFVFGVSPGSNATYLHPCPERILQLWQIFLENVDPLTKVIHAPTMQKAMTKAVENIHTVPKSFQALMCAIYSTAVMSLKDDECRRRFGESRRALLSSYISATKTALSRARLMGTTNLVVLQALTLHLLAIREIDEPRAVWTLTGVAMRIAEGMGLHRDGNALGLPPFESEMRRRLWWHLKMHDFRTAELSGIAKFSGLDTLAVNPPEPSANVNDKDLYPGMTTAPIEGNEPTDMTFCVIRSQTCHFAAKYAMKFLRQEGNSTQWHDYASKEDTEAKDVFIEELKDLIETKYLRYCDPSQPLQLLAMLFARSIANVGHFVTHHPRKWLSVEQTPESEQQYIWGLSIKLLEQYDMMQSNSHLQCFAWHAAYYTQWHALIHILDTLRARPLMSDAERAWQLIEATYKNNLEMLMNTKRPIYVAVGNLCLKAFNAREAAVNKNGFVSVPEYIMKLRQQREAAKHRRHLRCAGNENEGSATSYAPAQLTTHQDSSTTSKQHPSETPMLQEPHYDAQSRQIFQHHVMEPVNTSNSDTFWHTNGFSDGTFSGFDDMTMDTDFMLDQGQSLENTDGQGISWSQWDAWLSNNPGLEGMQPPN